MNNSKHVAQLSACFTVFYPRVFMYFTAFVDLYMSVALIEVFHLNFIVQFA